MKMPFAALLLLEALYKRFLDGETSCTGKTVGYTAEFGIDSTAIPAVAWFRVEGKEGVWTGEFN